MEEPPTVTQLTVEVSYDGGQTWQQAQVQKQPDGSYRVTATHPKHADEVSLRVSASDSDGNTVVQTLPEAFSVR